MAERAAVNASPLIHLAADGRLDLLRLAAAEIVVPREVADEVRRRGEADPTAKALAGASWIRIVDAPPTPPAVLAWDLGPGESAVLALAIGSPGVEAVIDDLQGRRCASSLGVPVRGTVGLVLLGKQRGIFPAARPVLESMRRAGMYLSDRTMNEALAVVRE